MGVITMRELFEGGVNFLQLKQTLTCGVSSRAGRNHCKTVTVILIYLLFLVTFPACDDLYDVYEEVYTLAPKWSDISFALKLPLFQVETIRKGAQGNDCNHCLQMVLNKWLQKSYKYDKYGPPSWRLLVKAVGDPFGGNNCALAETIANKHPGMRACTQGWILR